MTDVRIAGTGLTEFGQFPERTGRDLFAEAGLAALDESGVAREDVDSVLAGNFMGELAERQGHQGPLLAESVGLTAPATRIESACASSGVAVREAVTAIRGGAADVVLVGGVERMTNLDTAEATAGLAIAADALHEVQAGVTFPGAYALMADAYFETYGGDHEDLAHVAVKNHRHALDNEYAQFQFEIDVEDVLDAQLVADPLGLYDSCPISDGAAAAVLVSEEYAAAHDLDAPVAITGSGQGGDTLALQDRPSMARMPAAADAADEAFADAGLDREAVDAAEVHDCFTIAEVLALEAIGFYGPGEAIGAARRGETTAEGTLPTNLSGGLKAKGHPVGATGVGQVVDLAKLLGGERYPEVGAEVGVAHNAGGTGASATVHLLEVVA